MPTLPGPEFEAEYRFTHRGVMYQGYLDPLKEDAEANYQKEIDTCIPGLKGDKLQAVKAAFVDSLHFYPKKGWEKFLQLRYEYTPGDSATAAYKTLSTRVMGFSTGSTSTPSIPPKLQPPQDKPNNPTEENGGGDDDDDAQHPSTPPRNQGGGGGGGNGGGDPNGGGGGGLGRPPPGPLLGPQQPVAPIQTPLRIGRVKIKAPDIFNGDQE